MARVSPGEAADKWARRATAAVPDFQAGVRRVTQSPGAAAAQRVNEYVQGVQASASIWQQRVGSVPLGEWQQRTADLGGQRIASGVAAATPRMQQVYNTLLPAVDAAAQAARSLPGGSFEARVQRMVRFATEMHNFKMRGGR